MKKAIFLFVFAFSYGLIFSQDSVTFRSGSLLLNGTFSTPQGTGPFPVVVFSHGSGANDRDQTLPLTSANHACLLPGLYKDTVRNFKDLANSFNDHGIAVFRYDKRTYTHKNLNPRTITPYDFVQDIHAAVNFIKSQSKVDTSCIMLLGHSQGGNFISIVANERNDISALIALGTGARGIDSIIAIQQRDIYYKCLKDTLTGDSISTQTLVDFGKIRDGSWNPNTLYFGSYPKFWKEWIDITDSTIINYQNASQPTLLLHAMEDFNIPLEDARRFENQVNRSDFDVYYMNGLNHYFTTSTNPVVAQVVTDTIAQWLKKIKLNSNISTEKPQSKRLTIGYTSSQFIVTSNATELIQNLNVIDLNGRLVKSKLPEGDNKVYLEKTDFRKGMYLLVVQTNQNIYKYKVVIEN
ncbi:MAG: hypothetical protein CL840_18020 [Crocinitomicaceae bacterium]|nr:hypothetical protein [Crocinitomicaceae bacterium]|tara:strand:- start:30055 stop:31281 length:1227 start_codon:yes stop_codon:yes gene_type:complete